MTTDKTPRQKFDEQREALKQVLQTVSRVLLDSPDIVSSLDAIETQVRDLATLPKTIADLQSEKDKVDARLTQRLAALKPAKHATATAEAALKKLHESLAYNQANLAADVESDPAAKSVQTIGIKLPATRHERVAQLKAEIAEVERKIAETKAESKKAVTLVKSDTTRAVNLALRILEADIKLGERIAALPEMAKLAKKTAAHLKNRQEKRDRKAARKSTVPGIENADGTPVEFEDVRLDPLPKSGPTDAELREQAKKFFGHDLSDEDFAAIRDELVNA